MPKYTLTDEQYATFSAILLEMAGLHFDASKQSALQTHLRDRAHACHVPDLEAYLHLLQDPAQGGAELQRLIESVVIHETSFFRNKEHFSALNTIVIPALTEQTRLGARARTLRIWSAGCATGEEPYSLAITCLEHPALAGWKVEIIATDVSQRILEIARQGVYSSDALRYVSPERIARWFAPINEKPPAPRNTTHKQTAPLPAAAPFSHTLRPVKVRFSVVDEVRRLVTFRAQNLAEFPYDPRAFGDIDLLICENVLIYFNALVTRQVADQFYQALRPGGFLFLGYSETLWRVSTAFTLMTTPGTFFYQRPLPEPAPALVPPPAPAPSRPSVASPHPAAPPPAAGRSPSAPSAVPRLSTPFPLARTTPVPPMPTSPPAGRPPPAHTANVGAAVARNPAGVRLAQEKTKQGLEALEAGRYSEARLAFENALAQYPAAVTALVGLAQIHANQGDPDRAITECRRALELDALCEEAHLLLGLLYRQQDQLSVAIDHFSKAIYINFESVSAHFHLAELYRVQGSVADAAREYRRTLWALQQHPAHETIGAMPPALIRQVCEQQLRRLPDPGAGPSMTKGRPPRL